MEDAAKIGLGAVLGVFVVIFAAVCLCLVGGGNLSEGYTFAGGNNPELVAWYDANSDGKIHPVGEKMPNELGIYDMSGNSWEWCWDWFEERYYAESAEIEPTGSSTVPSGMMIEKSRRPGRSLEEAFTIRTAYRSADGIDDPGGNGFRMVRTADEPNSS